jgi:hypothetical protein
MCICCLCMCFLSAKSVECKLSSVYLIAAILGQYVCYYDRPHSFGAEREREREREREESLLVYVID